MHTPLSILVAEDDVGDVIFLQRAFAKAGVSPPIYFASNGQEVIDYLAGRPPFDNPVQYPLPNLLLLDLKLPQVSGFDVLRWVRGSPALHQLLVVVLSSSDNPGEIERAHALGANAYFIKPQNPTRLIDIVKRLQEYWLGINTPAEEALLAL